MYFGYTAHRKLGSPSLVVFRSLSQALRSVLALLTATGLLYAKTGGPDAFGTIFSDSTEPGGPIFLFEDIKESGSKLSLKDDELSDAIPIGFSFSFYGSIYSSLHISSNGFLTFLPGQNHGCCSGRPIPTTASPNAIIAGWWDDLCPSCQRGPGRSAIHSATLGLIPNRRFIVQFSRVRHYPHGTPVTFQWKLFEGTNDIEIHYLDAPSDGSLHSVGVENISGTIGLEYFHGTTDLNTPLAVRFTQCATADTTDDDGDGIPNGCDICLAGNDHNDGDGDGVPDACDLCPGRNDFMFDTNGSCPDVAFRAVILEARSTVETSDDPPDSHGDKMDSGTICIEIWVTKFSPDTDATPPDNPGLACAYVDIVFDVDTLENVSITHGEAFTEFNSGTFDNARRVTDLGGCTLADSGVGLWPQWVLLARLELEAACMASDCDDLDERMLFSFELNEPSDIALQSSIWGTGRAKSVHFGGQCDITVEKCRAWRYEFDDDCFIFSGDLSMFSYCWLKCPDDYDYDWCSDTFAPCKSDDECPTGSCLSCDWMNIFDCDEDESDDCVAPEDFAYWVTGWHKCCDDDDIIMPPDCDEHKQTASLKELNLPPWPTDDKLRSFGLEPPPSNWRGDKQGVVKMWRERDLNQFVIEDQLIKKDKSRSRGIRER